MSAEGQNHNGSLLNDSVSNGHLAHSTPDQESPSTTAPDQRRMPLATLQQQMSMPTCSRSALAIPVGVAPLIDQWHDTPTTEYLHVGQLPLTMSDDQLWRLFAIYGPLLSAKLRPLQPYHTSRVGTVCYANTQSALKAYHTLNGTRCFGDTEAPISIKGFAPHVQKWHQVPQPRPSTGPRQPKEHMLPSTHLKRQRVEREFSIDIPMTSQSSQHVASVPRRSTAALLSRAMEGQAPACETNGSAHQDKPLNVPPASSSTSSASNGNQATPQMQGVFALPQVSTNVLQHAEANSPSDSQQNADKYLSRRQTQHLRCPSVAPGAANGHTESEVTDSVFCVNVPMPTSEGGAILAAALLTMQVVLGHSFNTFVRLIGENGVFTMHHEGWTNQAALVNGATSRSREYQRLLDTLGIRSSELKLQLHTAILSIGPPAVSP